jgi:hypothetical protein
MDHPFHFTNKLNEYYVTMLCIHYLHLKVINHSTVKTINLMDTQLHPNHELISHQHFYAHLNKIPSTLMMFDLQNRLI